MAAIAAAAALERLAFGSLVHSFMFATHTRRHSPNSIYEKLNLLRRVAASVAWHGVELLLSLIRSKWPHHCVSNDWVGGDSIDRVANRQMAPKM